TCQEKIVSNHGIGADKLLFPIPHYLFPTWLMNIKDFVFTIDVCLQLVTFSAVIWKLFSLTNELRTGQVRNRENINSLINRLESLEKALVIANTQLLNNVIDRTNNNN
ncbi:MAG: hypothetical protein ACRC2J_13720, partial [Microcoleaceae cyanobacterium]